MSEYIDSIFESAMVIIRAQGRFVPNQNPNYLRRDFNDKKLSMSMYMDVRTEKVTTLMISLPIPTGDPSSDRLQLSPFSIGNNSHDDDTVVYYWSNAPHFTRPGKWIVYLRNLAEGETAKASAAHSLNRVPVDDAALFPDIE